MIIKHDDLYARALECEYEKAIFDNNQGETDIPNSPKTAVLYDRANNETSAFHCAQFFTNPQYEFLVWFIHLIEFPDFLLT